LNPGPKHKAKKVRIVSKKKAKGNRSLKSVRQNQMMVMRREIQPYRKDFILDNRVKRGDGYLRGEDFVQPISGATSFTLNSLLINPGLYGVFPLLYSDANNYESYSFEQLEMVFYPIKSMAADGQVMFGMDYDPLDVATAEWTTEQQLRNEAQTKVGTPHEMLVLKCDTKYASSIAARKRTVRSGVPPITSYDLRLFDVGRFYMGVTGCADTSVIGDLYIRYKIHFYKRKQNTIVPTHGEKDLTPAANTPLGPTGIYSASTATAVATSNTQVVISTDVALYATLQFRRPGTYLFHAFMTGTTLVVASTPAVAYSNESTIVKQAGAVAKSDGTYVVLWDLVFKILVPNGRVRIATVNSAATYGAVEWLATAVSDGFTGEVPAVSLEDRIKRLEQKQKEDEQEQKEMIPRIMEEKYEESPVFVPHSKLRIEIPAVRNEFSTSVRK
jgi:hypothetical protein